MTPEIKGFLAILVIGSIVVWLINIMLNDYATSWIDERNTKITDFLAERHLYIKTYSYHDCARSEVMYSVYGMETNVQHYLSSSQAKRLLIKLRNKKITRKCILDYFEQCGKPLKKDDPEF